MTWAQEYYEEGYARRWTLGPPSPETRGDADALASVLRLRGEARVLDVGCGHGRHAVTLAQLGVRVVGVDLASQPVAGEDAVGGEARSLAVADPVEAGDALALECGRSDLVLELAIERLVGPSLRHEDDGIGLPLG